MQFEVNALGPLRVVSALQHALAPGAKVAIITSKMGSLAEATNGAMVRRPQDTSVDELPEQGTYHM